MKNTTPDAAVLQELKELTSSIFKICEQNNMPVVIGYSYELNRNEDGYSINKSITAYADEKTGAWDSTIAAAAMLLKVKDVPREVRCSPKNSWATHQRTPRNSISMSVMINLI